MATDRTIDTADIARIFHVQRRYATEVIIKQPGFPAPSINLSQRIRRWNEREVSAFIKKQADARS